MLYCVIAKKTILSMTKFIEKGTYFYDAKLVTLNTSLGIFLYCTYGVIDVVTFHIIFIKLKIV